MKLTDIAPIKPQLAEQVLVENLGNLAQLNVGPLINVLRQTGHKGHKGGEHTSPMQNKFPSNTIGSTSEIVDVGVIKDGLKSIRKAYRARDTASAFALYIGGQAVLFAVFDDYAIAGASRVGRLAYDFTPFQEILDKIDDEEWNAKPEYQRWGTKQKTPATSYREKERSSWEQRHSGDTAPHRYQGEATSTGKLATTVDLVMNIAKAVGQPVTCKIVLRDDRAQKKRNERYYTRQEISDGVKDLKTRLAFYKNSKRPTVNTIEEFVKASITNKGKQVRFAGTTYVLKAGGYDKLDPGALLSGKPFDVSYSSSDPGVYDSLRITYMFDGQTNMLLPVFANWYDRTDPANKHKRQEAVLDDNGYLKMKLAVQNLDDKQNVVKKLLELFKATKFDEVMQLVTSLQKLGKDWPELATIQKSSQLEADKKKSA